MRSLRQKNFERAFGKPTLDRPQTPMKNIMEGTYEKESEELYQCKAESKLLMVSVLMIFLNSYYSSTCEIYRVYTHRY